MNNQKEISYKLLAMLGGAILISCTMVFVAMQLYNSSGTAQLDLSRPEYSSVRTKINNRDRTKTFYVRGDIGKKDLDKFDKTYSKTLKSIESYKDAFAIEKMGDPELGIKKEKNVESE